MASGSVGVELHLPADICALKINMSMAADNKLLDAYKYRQVIVRRCYSKGNHSCEILPEISKLRRNRSATLDAMQTSVISTAFFVALMLAANVSGQNGMLAPPNLPGNLKNPGALNNYLKALNEYQDALSRPRFGRSNNKRFPSNEFAQNLPEQIDQ